MTHLSAMSRVLRVELRLSLGMAVAGLGEVAGQIMHQHNAVVLLQHPITPPLQHEISGCQLPYACPALGSNLHPPISEGAERIYFHSLSLASFIIVVILKAYSHPSPQEKTF